MWIEIVCALMAYLIGSIPSAIWVGRKFYGIDVREHGSGNAGATNVFRVLGKGPGTVVLLMDIIKGFLSVMLAYQMGYYFAEQGTQSSQMTGFFPVAFGVLSVVGHMLPIFAKFKGGKGVATLFGVIIALDPRVAGLALLVFVVVNIVTGYVSVGSLMAGLSIPVLFLQVFGYRDVSLIVFSVSVGILIVYTHRKNIRRLMAGEETKSRILVRKQK
ncbi:MAG: glycerol-3-phosphate 1-O-acyltransferase PlsY [Bacteroidia bacterium]|jgi:glycerol-3-phosphate acyltransferase PlsY|nr:glycerol-3-phosphate 1-O-acyltransferase PlsY [Bacteroidia bacterium]